MNIDEEIKIIKDALDSIRTQAKKSGAKPPHSVLVKMVDLQNRLKKLKNLSGVNKEKPENLPENLESIRDAAIDFALGRVNSEPEDLKELYEWLELDGWDALVGKDSKEEFMLNIPYLADSCFLDTELEAWEGVPLGDITDEIRIKFARERITNAWGEDENMIKSVCAAELKNHIGESAFVCAMMDIQPGGATADWAGIFKSFPEYLNHLKNIGFVSESDFEKVTDEEILLLWNYEI